ncbi:MAG TPA: hypothetical protein VFH68_13035 [Polyangia bacterium]|jgi:hypothetical protein|nr:hypothetical protein [Polyangia bacterium]
MIRRPKLPRWLRRWKLLANATARVRQRSLAAGDGSIACEDELLQQACELMPRGYDVHTIHEYRGIDPEPALTWMQAQTTRGALYRYLPLMGRDCFTFAKDALQRAGAPVLLWQLYFNRADGVICRTPRRRPVNLAK